MVTEDIPQSAMRRTRLAGLLGADWLSIEEADDRIAEFWRQVVRTGETVKNG